MTGSFDDWFRGVLVRAALVLLSGLALAASLSVPGYWLAVGGLWTAALMVRAQVWAMRGWTDGSS